MSKKAFLFPGQASQSVGMGLDFYHRSAIGARLYEQAETQFDFSLKNVSFYGPLSKLTETKITQPAIYVLSIIIFEELRKRGIYPDAVAGHSLGEYTACVAAGCLDFNAGLRLVKCRAEQMQLASEATQGTMAAVVGLDYSRIEAIIKDSGFADRCTIANHNSPNQLVISGEITAVQSIMLAVKQAGAKRVIELTVGGAFHSPLMAIAGKELQSELSRTHFQPPATPLYCNVSGAATNNPRQIRDLLYRQLTSPVLWVKTIEAMQNDGITTFIEVGPGTVLQGLVKRIAPNAVVTGVATFDELEAFQCN